MPRRKQPKPAKHLAVISRRRDWDSEAFARMLAVFVLQQLESPAEDSESRAPRKESV